MLLIAEDSLLAHPCLSNEALDQLLSTCVAYHSLHATEFASKLHSAAVD